MTRMEVPPKIAFTPNHTHVKKEYHRSKTKVQSTFDIIDYLLTVLSMGGIKQAFFILGNSSPTKKVLQRFSCGPP
jgi:hypothetical protein